MARFLSSVTSSLALPKVRFLFRSFRKRQTKMLRTLRQKRVSNRGSIGNIIDCPPFFRHNRESSPIRIYGKRFQGGMVQFHIPSACIRRRGRSAYLFFVFFLFVCLFVCFFTFRFCLDLKIGRQLSKIDFKKRR